MAEIPSYLSCDPIHLGTYSRVPFQTFGDKVSLFQHFAREVADEVKTNNLVGKMTRLILPVGPVDQYPLLAENMESGKNRILFLLRFNFFSFVSREIDMGMMRSSIWLK